MFKRRTLVAFAATALLAAAPAFAQFADRTIKFTNGVTEDHPVGPSASRRCRRCSPPRPAAR